MTALEFATKAHEGQFRRDGVTPYINHPIEVAESFYKDSFEYEVALLHDVLEDTDVTKEQLKEHFGTYTAQVVEALTHKKGESYEEYIERISWDDRATQVKIADIAANLSDSPTERQIKKYANALKILAKNLDFGMK